MGLNAWFLNTSWISAQRHFVADLVDAIRAQGGSSLLSTVFSYGLQNEPYMCIDCYPYKVMSGKITTADGVQYDMSTGSDRHQSGDANFVHWVTQLADAIKAEDPAAMVSAYVIGEWDGPGVAIPSTPRDQMQIPDVQAWDIFPRATVMSLYTSFIIDYLEYHVYIDPVLYATGSPYSLSSYLSSSHSEFSQLNLSTMPVLAEEFGVQNDYVSGTACQTLVNHLQGLLSWVFAGGLLWTWNWIDQDGGIWNTGVGADNSHAVARGLQNLSCN